MKIPAYLFFLKKSFVLLLVYVAISLFLFRFNDDNTLSGVRWALMHTLEWVDALENRLLIRSNLQEENRRLKEENFELHTANQNLRELLVENARLKKLLSLKDKGEYEYIAARVIAQDVERGLQSIVLSVGEQDSVRKNMAVVNADGLIGKIISTSEGQSVVQILKDHDALVSARLQHSREEGVIGWSGNAWLDLNFIPHTIHIEFGELIVTSGLSNIYPAGLKIGVVTHIDESEHDLFKQIRVSPAVNFNAIEEVFIIRELTTEIDAVE